MELPERAAKNLMAATWTKAAKVRRAFKSGKKRQKDHVLTPRRAVIEAYAVIHELRAAMAQAGLPERDARGALVFISIEPEQLAYICPIPEPERLPELYGKARELEAQGIWLPLGLLLQQRDSEAANPADPTSGNYMWAQQWLMDARSARALLTARNIVAGGRVGEGGAIHDLN